MQVTVPHPDVKGRTEILDLYLSKIKMDPGTSQIFNISFFLNKLEQFESKPSLKPVRKTFVFHLSKRQRCLLTTGFYEEVSSCRVSPSQKSTRRLLPGARWASPGPT